MTRHITFSEYNARLRDFIRRRTPGDSIGQPAVGGETQDAFGELASRLFSLQFDHVAPYRRFCEARNITPRTITRWSEIPAVPTAAFKEYELSSLPVQERTTVFHSSGTTARRPSRHFHNADSLAMYARSLLPWFQCHLLPVTEGSSLEPANRCQGAGSGHAASGDRFGSLRNLRGQGDARTSTVFEGSTNSGPGGCGASAPIKPASRFLILTASPALAPHSSLVHMFETVRREFGSETSLFAGSVGVDGGWVLDKNQIWSWLLQATSRNEPVVLLGTAFSFVELLDWMKEKKIHLPLAPGSRVLETGGYKGRTRALPKDDLYVLITERLGIPLSHIVCEYGMSELSSQAYDSVVGWGESQISNLKFQINRRLFRFPPWARWQIISPETGQEVGNGETGLIRVFDLANVRSVMAVQTEDLGVSQGGGFQLAGRAAFSEPRGCSLMAR